jgi:N-carbamoyl-L-amino-acid hydrolase
MSLSLDVRAYDERHLASLEATFLQLVAEIEAARGVHVELGPRTQADVAPSHPELRAKLTDAARALGVPTMPLASPASHDTATFTSAGVPACMLFVRNANGSHNPAEAMEIDDFMQTCLVLARWLTHEVAGDA